MIRKVTKTFTEAQESIINELGYILNEMICGRQEEAYTALRDLKDELVRDILISKGKELNNADNEKV